MDGYTYKRASSYPGLQKLKDAQIFEERFEQNIESQYWAALGFGDVTK